MENYIVTLSSLFIETHGGFNIALVAKIAKAINYKIIVIGKDISKQYIHNLLVEDHSLIKHIISIPYTISIREENPTCINRTEIIQDYVNKNMVGEKIDKILFFVDWHLWTHLKPLRDISKTVITFNRLNYRKLNDVYAEYNIEIPDYFNTILSLQDKMVQESDYLLAGSENCKENLLFYYPKANINIVPIFSSKNKHISSINYKPKFNSNNVVIIGRTDVQKGFFRLKQKIQKYNIIQTTSNYNLFTASDNLKENWNKIKWYDNVGDSLFALFPAIYETRGLVLQEAMCLGLIPIVEKKSYGYAEQIDHGINGFLVDFDENVDVIIDDIKAQYDLNYLENMSKNNRLYFEEKSFIDSFLKCEIIN